jgi:hypothetical protein
MASRSTMHRKFSIIVRRTCRLALAPLGQLAEAAFRFP